MIGYKEIPGFSGYRAYQNGSIWSCWRCTGRPQYTQVQGDTWHQLCGSPRKEDSRVRYTLRAADGSYVRKYGSYFVLLAFVGPRPTPKHEARHIDGNCLNDAPDNLAWGTSLENKADMLLHGTRQCGSQINTAKLMISDILEIRRIGYPLKPLAERFGVTTALISAILRRKVWQHV